MNLACTRTNRRRARQSALTLLELMVAMSVLTFIIFGLYSMFDRTQKAFLETTTQKDVLEGGRNFSQMIVRDLEQMHASNLSGRTNLYIQPIIINSYPINGFSQNSMVGSNRFTNQVQEFFFLTRTSQWTGIAYLVGQMSTNRNDEMLYTNLGVGTLRRFAYTTNDYYHKFNDLLLYYMYTNANTTNHQIVADGVIHLALRTYDKAGNYVDTSNYSYTNTFLPAWVELEVAVLEPKVLLQARSIGNAAAQKAFLQETTNRASAVHLFRQRLAVRNAN